VQIGTRMVGGPKADAGAEPDGKPDAVRQPVADGTLLAVVPIPGTGTSLAIVGYPITASGSAAAPFPVGPVPQGHIPAGPDLESPDLESPDLESPDLESTAREGTATADGRSGLLLDQDQRRVWADGAEVSLTFQEFELLAFLAAHPATVFSRADLVRAVWQRDFAADSRTVDVHVSRLRHKLGPSCGKCLVTEYRVGYQFRPRPAVTGTVRALAADVRAGLGDGDAQQHALLPFHRRTVVVPVRVLAGDIPVVGDEAVHRLGKLHDLGGALELGPAAVEAVGECAQPDPGVAADVPHLVGGLPGADGHPALRVNSRGDR
jgi:DNA-binding winged helix-turn-helix (wHTH) protein